MRLGAGGDPYHQVSIFNIRGGKSLFILARYWRSCQKIFASSVGYISNECISNEYSLFEVSLPSANAIKFHSIEARCNPQQLCIAVRDESKKKVCHR